MPRPKKTQHLKPSEHVPENADSPAAESAYSLGVKTDIPTSRAGGRRRRELLLQRQPIPAEILLAAAKNTKQFNAHFRKTAPNEAQWLSKAASMIWQDAVDTVYALYEASQARSENPHYRIDLTHLVSAEARNALILLAKHHHVAKTKGVVREAYMTLYREDDVSGPEIVKASGKAILHEIRESLRDFGDASRAIAHNEELIAGMAEAGNEDFFADLGEIIKDWRRKPEKFTQTATSRIIFRAWLPLKLWECGPDGLEADKRCREAARILRQSMPNFTEFLSAWRTFRSRVARPLSQPN